MFKIQITKVNGSIAYNGHTLKAGLILEVNESGVEFLKDHKAFVEFKEVKAKVEPKAKPETKKTETKKTETKKTETKKTETKKETTKPETKKTEPKTETKKETETPDTETKPEKE